MPSRGFSFHGFFVRGTATASVAISAATLARSALNGTLRKPVNEKPQGEHKDHDNGKGGHKGFLEREAIGTKFGSFSKMVGAIGFEPTTSWSQTRRSTRLSYTPYLPRNEAFGDGVSTHSLPYFRVVNIS